MRARKARSFIIISSVGRLWHTIYMTYMIYLQYHMMMSCIIIWQNGIWFYRSAAKRKRPFGLKNPNDLFPLATLISYDIWSIYHTTLWYCHLPTLLISAVEGNKKYIYLLDFSPNGNIYVIKLLRMKVLMEKFSLCTHGPEYFWLIFHYLDIVFSIVTYSHIIWMFERKIP